MNLAIQEGKKSVPELGKLTPKVGASISRDGKILGTAFRGQKGIGDHAEYTLFEKVLMGDDVKGASLFTTLEPCTHRGKNKPCTDWVIEKGIKHIYIGLLDPNPKIYNNGCKKLKAAGIEVSYFPKELRKEIVQDNADFIKQYYANPELQGIVTFNYSNNDHKYIIGNNEMMFETQWSKAGITSIHAYDDPGTIKAIAIADGNNNISEIKDGAIYDASSRARTVALNEILVLENNNDYYAAIKILHIGVKGQNATNDELIFEYKILEDKTSNFAK